MTLEGWEQTLGTGPLLGIAAASIAVLLLLIIRFKVHAFVALILVSLLTAAAAGIPTAQIVPVLTSGFGSTLASVALLVGLGAMLGRIVEVSAAPRSSRTPWSPDSARSEHRSPWASRRCSSASRSSSTRAWWSCCPWSSPWAVDWAARC